MLDMLVGLFDNGTFTGLVFAGAIASLVVTLKGIPAKVIDFLRHQLCTTLAVRNSNPAYDDIIVWLSRLPFGKDVRKLSVVSNNGGYEVALGYGSFWFFYEGIFFMVTRQIDTESKAIAHNGLPEIINITAITRNNKTISTIIKKAAVRPTDMICIHSWFGWWRKIDERPRRSIDSVALPIAQKSRIVSDITWYLNSEEWFQERNIPWRRGYLFYGPPGTGKTSLVFALASYIGKPLYLLSLTAVKNDNDLLDAMASIPTGSIVLMEDIDAVAVTNNRENVDTESTNGVTLSGLLNVLDGVAAPEGRLLFMTTNFRNKLDPALVRAGRADVHELIGPLGDEEIEELSERICGPNHGIRIYGPKPAAEVQSILIQHLTANCLPCNSKMET